MKLNYKTYSSLAALALGAFLGLPTVASSATISFNTAATSASEFGLGTTPFNYTSTTIAGTTVVAGTPLILNGQAPLSSFGYFTEQPANAVNSNVVDVKVTPTVGGITGAALDFHGVVSAVGPAFLLDFSTTVGATSVNVAGVTYTSLVFGGYDFAVQTLEQLPTSVGKIVYLNGVVQTAPSSVPEPATVATTGLALALSALLIRRFGSVSSK